MGDEGTSWDALKEARTRQREIAARSSGRQQAASSTRTTPTGYRLEHMRRPGHRDSGASDRVGSGGGGGGVKRAEGPPRAGTPLEVKVSARRAGVAAGQSQAHARR
jgi:hypothetical protein